MDFNLKTRLLILNGILAALAAMPARAEDIAVIVSADSPIDILDKREVIDIYMGRYQRFPNGTMADTLDYAAGTLLRQQFYEDLVNLNERKIKAYWSRLLFSGKALPPSVTDSLEDLVERVATSENAIGYIPLSRVTDEVKVVLIIEQGDRS